MYPPPYDTHTPPPPCAHACLNVQYRVRTTPPPIYHPCSSRCLSACLRWFGLPSWRAARGNLAGRERGEPERLRRSRGNPDAPRDQRRTRGRRRRAPEQRRQRQHSSKAGLANGGRPRLRQRRGEEVFVVLVPKETQKIHHFFFKSKGGAA